MAVEETNVTHAIMKALSPLGVVLWKNIRGRFRPIYGDQNRIITAGLSCDGSSDLIGLREITITPEMVGQKIAVFVAIECKRPSGGRKEEDQINFIQRQLDRGAYAGFARSVEDAKKICGL